MTTSADTSITQAHGAHGSKSLCFHCASANMMRMMRMMSSLSFLSREILMIAGRIQFRFALETPKSLSETRRHLREHLKEHLNYLSAKHWNPKLRTMRCLRWTSFVDRKMLESLLDYLNLLPFCFARPVVVPCL